MRCKSLWQARSKPNGDLPVVQTSKETERILLESGAYKSGL